jgi:dihydropteroate synthase
MMSQPESVHANTAWQCGRYTLNVSKPLIMGIVNLTDDSFSGDGCAANLDHAIAHAQQLMADGADILDLGAESSRPGAFAVPEQQEIDRLLPLIEALRDCGVPVSIDTVKPGVMRAVLAAGADMINDINALSDPAALAAVASSQAAVCLMHKQGTAQTMQQDPQYQDVLTEVARFLAERVAAAQAAGIARNRLCIDPGFGFGKTLAHNLALLRGLHALKQPGIPLLVGMSRKSMLGAITGRSVDERTSAGLAAHILAVQGGAHIVRVHDVAATRDALQVLNAYKEN